MLMYMKFKKRFPSKSVSISSVNVSWGDKGTQKTQNPQYKLEIKAAKTDEIHPLESVVTFIFFPSYEKRMKNY